MKTSAASMQRSIEDLLILSAGAFPASLSVQPDGERARKMTDTSGRRLAALLNRSGPAGSFLKMLLDCSPFWSRRVYLNVEIKAVELFCADKAQPQTSAIVRLQKRVIGSIISEIGAAGYVLPQLADGTPVVLCIPACAVNAPHRRDRVWFVAHADNAADRQHCDQPGRRNDLPKDEQAGQKAAAVAEGRADRAYPAMGPDPNPDRDGQHRGDRSDEVNARNAGIYGRGNAQPANRYAADPGSQGLEGTEGQGVQRKGGQPSRFAAIPGWDKWPAQPAVCGGNDGIPRELDGITFSKWRTESVKAYGNAIVPQIALELFKVIEQFEKGI